MAIRYPDYTIHSLLQTEAARWKSGAWYTDADVFGSEVPVAKALEFRNALMDRGVRVSFSYPESDADLPQICVISESWSTREQALSNFVSGEGQDRAGVVNETVVADATAGQTTGTLDHVPVIDDGTVRLYKNGGAGFVPTTFDPTTGAVTFPALALHDVLTADYAYVTPVTQRYGELTDLTIRVFVVTHAPEATMLLAGLVWRKLTLNLAALRAGGLESPSLSFASLSPWAEVLPTIGFRREIVVQGWVENTVAEVSSPATAVSVDLDGSGPVQVQSDVRFD